jgi:hypothetical protein
MPLMSLTSRFSLLVLPAGLDATCWGRRGACGGRGSRGWCSRGRAWPGMRRGRRCARRGSRGPRRWPCRRRGAGSARRTAGGVPCWRRARRGTACPVEPLPGVRAGRDGEQRQAARLGDESGQGGGTVLGAHAALEDDRVVPEHAQGAGNRLQVVGPVGEDEAVPALGECGGDVGDDLLVALVAGDEVLVDDGHSARCGRAGVSGVPVGGRVEAEYRGGPPAGGCRAACAGCRRAAGAR